MYGCNGSVAHHNSDIYADTAPQDFYIPASFWVMGEAWMATHIWEHFVYTGDKRFWKKTSRSFKLRGLFPGVSGEGRGWHTDYIPFSISGKIRI